MYSRSTRADVSSNLRTRDKSSTPFPKPSSSKSSIRCNSTSEKSINFVQVGINVLLIHMNYIGAYIMNKILGK